MKVAVIGHSIEEQIAAGKMAELEAERDLHKSRTDLLAAILKKEHGYTVKQIEALLTPAEEG